MANISTSSLRPTPVRTGVARTSSGQCARPLSRPSLPPATPVGLGLPPQLGKARRLPVPPVAALPIIREAPHLAGFAHILERRQHRYDGVKAWIEKNAGSLEAFANSYERYGLHRREGGVEYVEWAPAASELSLVGDFNGWERGVHAGVKDEFGVWRVWIPDSDPVCAAVTADALAGGIGATAPAPRGAAPGEPAAVVSATRETTASVQNRIIDPLLSDSAGAAAAVAAIAAASSKMPLSDDTSPGPPEDLPPPEEANLWRPEDVLWGTSPVPHGSRVRVVMEGPEGTVDRVPAWIRYCKRDPAGNYLSGVMYDPPAPYTFQNPKPGKSSQMRIYECHVGMSSADPRIATYREFADTVLPRIRDLGYDTIQVMAVQEHALYSSFGYQVTSPFAVSSRSGTPEDLKELVDRAHGMGIRVLLDVVHAHASSNTFDGLNYFDGSDACFFYEGGQGRHGLWGTRIYNYDSYEVQRYLLANLQYFLKEFQFDGFRFDGVTAMLYNHRGIHWQFLGGDNEYFSEHVDEAAVTYLKLANELIHMGGEGRGHVSIAEDVSGFAGLCRPLNFGGCGFDYRLSMGPPDVWQEWALSRDFGDWGMGEMVHMLVSRREKEKNVAYVESHDQALVGGQSLAFALMGAEMYSGMGKDQDNGHVQWACALHKNIRLLTLALGGEAYLNFMGNEFGHPEWVDFPRAGNNESYWHARRRWDLADDPSLRFGGLQEFDRQLMHMAGEQGMLLGDHRHITMTNEDGRVIICERGDNLLVFNFSDQSYADYRLGTKWHGEYKLCLDSDSVACGGYGRLDHEHLSTSFEEGFDGREFSMCVYSPSMSCQVYEVVTHWEDTYEYEGDDNDSNWW